MSIHRRYTKLPGSSGSRWMPRKIAGRAMSRLEALIIAMRKASVVFESTTHLYSTRGLPW